MLRVLTQHLRRYHRKNAKPAARKIDNAHGIYCFPNRRTLSYAHLLCAAALSFRRRASELLIRSKYELGVPFVYHRNHISERSTQAGCYIVCVTHLYKFYIQLALRIRRIKPSTRKIAGSIPSMLFAFVERPCMHSRD